MKLDRSEFTLILAIVVMFGLVAVAVGFFNLGIKAEQQYSQFDQLD